jgi:DNA polymerase-4
VIELTKIYFHIDVNNAFLSWEAVKRLKEGETTDLRTIPSAVAGDPKNRTGIILAKSKPAKDKGVKTGEPIFSAMKKCPNLICVPPNHKYYEKESIKLRKILEDFSDEVIPYSIDECFITYIPLLGEVMEVANNIKERIFNELGFTVNIGISDTRYLAKVASDFEKPNKIHTLYTSEIKEKFWPLPIENMFLLGSKTANKLKTLGIDTVYKLANTDINILKAHLKSQGEDLYNYAWGKDIDERHQKHETPKSIGHSKTSPYDLTDLEYIYSFMLDVVQDTSNRLRAENMKANTITVTLKTSNFKIYSMAQTLPFATNGTNEIFNDSKNIFNKMYKGEPLRLIGISLSNLEPDETTQLNIFETFNEKEHKLDKTVDDILKKFGNNLVTRASLIHNDKTKNNNN